MSDGKLDGHVAVSSAVAMRIHTHLSRSGPRSTQQAAGVNEHVPRFFAD